MGKLFEFGIWKDQWLPRGSLRGYIEGLISIQDEDQQVSSLRAHHFWTFEALNFPFPSMLLNLIQGILIAQFTPLLDTLAWPYNNGTCSMKSASKFLYHTQNIPFNAPGWKWI